MVEQCNLCGRDMDFYDEQQDFRLHKKIQYGSKYDGKGLGIKLCCKCMDWLIDECAISPVFETGVY